MNNGLNLRCENCGQPATDTDVVCFHCGQPLPGREELPEPAVKVNEGWQQTVSPTAAVAYIGIGLLVLIAFLLVTRSLGQRPLAQVGFATRPSEGWQQVVNIEEDFLFYLPLNWDSIDGSDPNKVDDINQKLNENAIYQLASQPFASIADDIEVIYMAENGTPDEEERFAFLIVGRSPLLSNLSYVEVIDIWNNDPRLDSEAIFIDDFAKSHAEAILLFPVNEIEDDANLEALRCRQHFVRGENDSLLLSLCSPADRFLPRSSTFEEINSSFQRLES